MFGPDPQPLKMMKLKKMRTKVKPRSEMERRRKPLKQERQKRREEKKQRRAVRREEEKERRAEGGEIKVTKVKAKRDGKSTHGKEQVDSIILKLLGKSHKSKRMTGKGPNKVVEKKVGTQEETVGTKWKPGMKEEAGEGWQKERKLKQKAKSAKSSKKEETSSS